jgi:hypothetical protein
MPGGYDYFYTLQEICVLLNLLPNTFRQIAREYSDLIIVREQVRKGRKVMGLPRADFETFRAIVELRAKGRSNQEIRAKLGVGPGPADAPVFPAEEQPEEGLSEDVLDGNDNQESHRPSEDSQAEVAATVDGSLAERLAPGHPAISIEKAFLVEIAELKDEIRRMDERRREERDKLLTVLMRTQHELQSLRYEVGASLSRRDRKKKRGFWAWLFDL